MIPFSNRFLLIFRHNIYLQLLLDYYYLFELSFYSTINKSIIFGDENKKRCFCLQLYEDMLQRSTDVDEFIRMHDQIYVVEMNRDGQLHKLLSLAYPEAATSLKSVAFGDGMPASARWVREGVLAKYAQPAEQR